MGAFLNGYSPSQEDAEAAGGSVRSCQGGAEQALRHVRAAAGKSEAEAALGLVAGCAGSRSARQAARISELNAKPSHRPHDHVRAAELRLFGSKHARLGGRRPECERAGRVANVIRRLDVGCQRSCGDGRRAHGNGRFRGRWHDRRRTRGRTSGCRGSIAGSGWGGPVGSRRRIRRGRP